MTGIFSNPKFGVFVTITHIFVCAILATCVVRSLNASTDKVKDMSKEDKKIFALLLTLLVMSLLKIILSFVLIVGIVKKNHHLMAPWIAATFISMVAVFFYTLVALAFSFVNTLKLRQNAERVLPGMGILITQIGFFYPIFVLYQSVLVFRLKREGIYEGPQESFNDHDSELVDSNEVY
ncbi:uncharacterized protein LOC106088046 [Stomoxys calcitrans]|uniref:uncharacterized protein LOC106088046 n=1 Tax=Stomoxys calcitrans TaxID=35570 RepID=UPI0027E36100|nr:uncharacterized protein LOC106088046 [Stomoxys calcitrans]